MTDQLKIDKFKSITSNVVKNFPKKKFKSLACKPEVNLRKDTKNLKMRKDYLPKKKINDFASSPVLLDTRKKTENKNLKKISFDLNFKLDKIKNSLSFKIKSVKNQILFLQEITQKEFFLSNYSVFYSVPYFDKEQQKKWHPSKTGKSEYIQKMKDLKRFLINLKTVKFDRFQLKPQFDSEHPSAEKIMQEISSSLYKSIISTKISDLPFYKSTDLHKKLEKDFKISPPALQIKDLLVTPKENACVDAVRAKGAKANITPFLKKERKETTLQIQDLKKFVIDIGGKDFENLFTNQNIKKLLNPTNLRKQSCVNLLSSAVKSEICTTNKSMICSTEQRKERLNKKYKKIDFLTVQTRLSTQFLEKAINNIKPNLEVRKVRRGGTTYQVPTILREKRSEKLAIQWLIESAQKNKKKYKLSFSESLANELVQAFQKSGEARQKRNIFLQLAESNRAYIRYRWW